MKFDGLDLPIFDPERELIVGTSQLNKFTPADGQDTFLRYVYTTGPGEQSLKDRLQVTEDEFERISELCGTTIINHTFGLYPIEDPKYLHLHQSKVPDNYVLVAEVAVVREIPTYKFRPLNIWRGVHRYRQEGGLIGDIRRSHFQWGRQAGSTQAEWIMIDVEPRLSSPHVRPYLPV